MVIQSDELVVGEVGYGKTVLLGEEIISFPVRYLGKLDNSMPGVDMPLVRVEGHEFDTSGVIAGMSGSPIYFRGRLLGALAYAWGFAKEPIAGVTPIKHMLRLIDEQETMAAAPTGFRRIDAPLSVVGLSPDGKGEAWKRVNNLGFLAAPGGRVDANPARLEPGSALGVRLIDGDISVTAVGTVTHVDDSAVIAFGHPFLNRGYSAMPMTGARIAAIMPVQSISFKMGVATNDIGTIRRDASVGIAGTLGSAPEMIPMSVDVAALWGRRSFHYRIAKDFALSPLLFDIAWAESAEAGLFSRGPAGVEVGIDVTISGRTVRMRDRGVVDQSVLEIIPTLPLTFLYENEFRRIHPEAVTIRVDVNDDLRKTEIIQLRPLRSIIAPGETLPIEVTFRTFEQGRWFRRFDFYIPERLPDGVISLAVQGGRGLGRDDLPAPWDLESLVDRLAAYEPQDMLVIRGFPADGRRVEIEGGMLSDLPASVQGIHEGAMSGPSDFVKTVQMDVPLGGAATASVEIRKEK